MLQGNKIFLITPIRKRALIKNLPTQFPTFLNFQLPAQHAHNISYTQRPAEGEGGILASAIV